MQQISDILWPMALTAAVWIAKQGLLEYLKAARERTVALQAVEAAKAAVVGNAKIKEELQELKTTMSALSNAIMQQR